MSTDPVNELARNPADLLAGVLEPDEIVTEPSELEYLSADVYSAGPTAAGAIVPSDRDRLAAAVGKLTAAGYAVIARGGGMSYTGGYRPDRDGTVIVDTRRLNRILDVSEEDMCITVEAGVTWQQIYEELKPKGLRLPFFGTFSGAVATVGGGMSNGALFMATARYGTSAEIVLGLEVVLADGTVVKTGMAGLEKGRPFYRSFGPDLTGVFVHDAGSLGIKTEITMRLIREPSDYGFASFAFADNYSVARGLSAVAREGVAEEAYVFDPDSSRKNMESVDMKQALKSLASVVRAEKGLLKGLRKGAGVVAAGKDFIDEDVYTLHVVCANRSEAGMEADLEAVHRLATEAGGVAIPDTVPRTVRAEPFLPLNGVLGPHGDRWAALNAKVRHSDAAEIIERTEAVIAEYQSRLDAHRIYISRLMIAISNTAFSYEPVFHWYDEWLPVHRRTPEPSHLATLEEPAADPEARELVHEVRAKIVDLFREFGAASNQIGKTYPYVDVMVPGTRRVLQGIKDVVDPDCRVNPGVLGFKASDS